MLLPILLAVQLLDPAAVNTPVTTPITQGAEGPAVVRAQILLDRSHFSPGEIDGSYGENVVKAVTAFQTLHNLPANGIVGPETWAVLNQDTAPALVSYTVTEQDVAGPFVQVPSSLMDQAKLEALDYQSPAEALGERFHASPGLLAALNPGAQFRAGEQIRVPNVAVPSPGPAARVEVSRSCGCVMTFAGDGRLLSWYAATLGSSHDPLPLGEWRIKGVRRYPAFHYNSDLFWDAKSRHEKARIAPGPNNPVGVVWIALSKPHYGIHGTPDPSRIGHAFSHGCIRLTNWDAWELASMVKPGTPAILDDAPAEPALSRLVFPVPGVDFRGVVDTFNQARPGGKPHQALDIMAPRGAPVVAVDDGEIVKLFHSKAGGLTIYQFDDSGAWCYYYAHLDRYAEGLREHMSVKRGDRIGYVGSTGDASPDAPHLHFAIYRLGPEKRWWEGTPINPYPVFRNDIIGSK